MINIRQDVYSRLIYTLFFTLIISVFLTGYSLAVTRTVTNLNDDGNGSLRDIMGNVAQPGDDIVFDPSLAGETINLTTGVLPIIGFDLTITGPADNPITLDANMNDRIFEISGGANVVLSNLIIANGFISGGGIQQGGAILTDDDANLEVNDCTFINNSVEADCSGFCAATGGAISTDGRLTVRRSTFVGNSAHCSTNEEFCFSFGGAIDHEGDNDDLLVLENNTLCDNEVTCSGSGCFLIGGALSIEDPPGLLNNNTFSNNKTFCDSDNCLLEIGSSIGLQGNPFTATELLNNIIHNDPGVTVPNCGGPEEQIIDGGNNLQFPGTSCGATIPTADAMLGPLADNGGITQTKAITEESPAFNEGNNATCEATDQRGVPRPQALICDIGAYELIVPSEIPTLSEWGLIAMAGILGIVGFMVMRRRAVINS